jgi:uncharacterized protein (DUF736 family)
MRNSVAKKLRKEAGIQTSTSNQMEYEYLKREHMKTEVNPKFKVSARQHRIGRVWKTITTSTLPHKGKRRMYKELAKLKG